MNANTLLDNLSSHLKHTIAQAIAIATSLGYATVDPIHILYALLQEKGSVGAEILTKLGLKEDTLLAHDLLSQHSTTLATPAPGTAQTALLPELSEPSRRALEKAMLLAYEYEHKYIGTEHLLCGLMSLTYPEMTLLLKKNGISKKQVLEHVDIVLTSTTRFPEMEDVTDIMDELDHMNDSEQGHKPTVMKAKKIKKAKPTAIDLYATHLTDPAIAGDIDPVIGRDEEMKRLMHVLSRRTKNNPVLVGEPGVGKTAIVEGLAKRIVEGAVPDVLRHKKIYALDLALMISGTIYRGEFEARLKQLIDEVSAMPQVILFIDELHTIIGAGSNQGTMDAANILKPALARGKLRCIGATTIDEYTKYISGDPALERRFQSIHVGEPSAAEAKTILTGLKKQYDQFHGVSITPAAIDAAVTLSMRYMHESFLPDKAIDLLDEAAASVRMERPLDPQEKLRYTLRDEREAIIRKKEEAIVSEAFEDALDLKKQEEALDKKIATIRPNTRKRAHKPPVTDAHVAAVLSRRIGITTDELLCPLWQKLDTVKKRISEELLGQEPVLHTIVNRLKAGHLKKNTDQPQAAFLFLGPSGVGKTSMAKALATHLYHDAKALIRFDMSEFSEGHSISKILGSPAGYVGHKERNRFTEQMRQKPYSVILFDEIDKAHPDVIRLLLQMLDEGMLTDSSGKKISFAHSIIILTSNIGAELYKSAGIGFDKSSGTTSRDEQLRTQAKDVFGATLLGRLSDICIFSELTPEVIALLVKRHIADMSTLLQEKNNVRLTLSPKTLQILAKKAYNSDTGARHTAHIVEHIVHTLLLDVLSGATPPQKQSLTLQEHDGTFHLV